MTGDALLWYFAYGSNLDSGTFEGRRRMQPLSHRVARLDGYRLVFDLPIGKGERAVANLAAAPLDSVHGVAYQLSEGNADRLDRTEGVPHGVYDRLPVELFDRLGRRFEAFTYGSRHRRAGRKPSARYMGLILSGARRYRLPDPYIEFLEAFELAVDERNATDGG